MSMPHTSKVLRGAYTLLILATTMVAPVYFTMIGLNAFGTKGAYWMEADPDYFYFISGLNLACGGRSGFPDHPGMGLKYLIVAIIRISHPFLHEDALRLTVLAHSENYMRVTNVVTSLAFGVLTLLTAMVLMRATRDVVIAIAAQSGPLFYAYQYLYFSQKIAAELLLLVLAQALCLVCAMVLADQRAERNAWRYALLSAFICALATSTKMNFAPLLVIPCFVVPRIRWKACYVVGCVAFLCVFLAPLPMPLLMGLFRRSLSSGAHAGGEMTLIPSTLVPTLKIFVASERPFFTVLGMSVAIALAGALGAIFSPRLRRSRVWMVLLGVSLGATIQVVAVAKNEFIYYMMPAFGLCGFLLAVSALMVRNLPWGRIVPSTMAYALIAGALCFGLSLNSQTIKKSFTNPPVRCMRLNQFYHRIMNDRHYNAVIMLGAVATASHPTALYSGDIHQQSIRQNRYAIGALYPNIYYYLYLMKTAVCFENNGEVWSAGAILREHTNVLFITREHELFQFKPEQMDLVATSGESEVAYCFKRPDMIGDTVAQAEAIHANTNMELDQTLFGTVSQPMLVGKDETNRYANFPVYIPESSNYSVICNYATRMSRSIDISVNGIMYVGIGVPATPGNGVRNLRRLLIPNIGLNAGTNVLCFSSSGTMPQIESIAITR